MSDRVLPTMCMDGNLKENWNQWMQYFKIYLKASETDKKPEDIQCAILLHYVGHQCICIYNTFTFDDNERDKIDVLLKKFTDYFNSKTHLTYERHKFFSRNQQTNETIDQYVTELKNQASNCEFGQLKDDLIKTRIICGILNNEVRKSILQDDEMTLEKVVQRCRSAETANEESQSIAGGSTGTNNAIMALKKKDEKEVAQNPKKKCGKCGNNHPKNRCPAYKKKCMKCLKFNHFANQCRTKNINEVNNSEENTLFLGMINSEKDNEKIWEIILNINNKNINFKIDTGAQVNCIPINVFKMLNLESVLLKNRNNLTSYSGTKVNTIGTCYLNCQYENKTFSIYFYIVDHPYSPPVLGLQTCIKLNLIKRVMSIDDTALNTLLEKYNSSFNHTGLLNVKPHKIILNENAISVIHPPRKIPFALEKELKKELDNLEENKIIEKVNFPTEWVNSIVLVRKPNGSLRICLDPRQLNKYIKREHFKIPTIDEIICKIKNAKYFTTLDASQGFWQVPLHKESSLLCTFNTPFGRYCYLRLPYGISSASEIFQKIIKQIFDDIENVEIYIDDILIWANSLEEHNKILKSVLERASEYGLTFNKNKSKICVQELVFLGHKISANGIEPDKSKLKAIINMSKPNDKKSLHRFLGMTTYVSRFIPNFSEITNPLREILKKNVSWFWGPKQDEAFNKLKHLLVKPPVLKFFDVDQPLTLSVDASQNGVGATIMQEGRPVAYASKALSETQKNYSQIEKELYAVLYGCDRFSQYTFGRKINVETDHKPLISIFNKPLSLCPQRLQRIMLKLLSYDINIKHVPGKNMYIADTLSRATTSREHSQIDDDIECHVFSLIENLNITKNQLKKFKNETNSDLEMQNLKKCIRNNWKKYQSNSYKKYKNNLTIYDDLIFLDNRLVIPKTLRHEILQKIHFNHLGVNKCNNRAKQCVFWPNMTNDIENLISKCYTCKLYQNKLQKEPLIPHELPKRAWQKLGVDLFMFDNVNYLMIVDYFSKFIEIPKMTSTTSVAVINQLKSIFSRHGIPETIISDNGPQFISLEFKNFSTQWEFKHITSSARYSQSNGMAERHIQTVKNMLYKAKADNKDPYLSLLELRNTPLELDGKSPSELLMGRKLRGILPISLNSDNSETHYENLKNKQIQQKQIYDRNAKPLSTLKEGEKVLVKLNKKQWEKGEIVKQNDKPRSYKIKMSHDSVIERNRRFLNPLNHDNNNYNNNTIVDSNDRPILHNSNDSDDSIDDVTNLSLLFDEEPVSYTNVQTKFGRLVKPPDRFTFRENN